MPGFGPIASAPVMASGGGHAVDVAGTVIQVRAEVGTIHV